ncbi:carboxymuconolactone decarboxylase family protein [Allokutzneria sp. A3M-2-11 16]|uniref:carboxymuconolactone decarboxylase family protein n=1 Tax=Allokutzneria sp. A3M-2-11 16 TaxID=2962043 RepID=UPI0020B81660|nr:carboxymuconolactone decarboxylase family protein [Allokutzneria sp. A3M-2-11 16]MCP3800170.1 carboxymuconolactone decarboxylase family protein [Allokutzneria sp. A3M-2-11 16]
MSLEALRAALPGYAEDIEQNLGLMIDGSALSERQLWGTVVAVAAAARNAVVLRELVEEAAAHVPAEVVTAAKAAASIMAMNNVYFRAKHVIGADLPARLRMRVVARLGVDKIDFELWCLAVSAINGCEVCVRAHHAALDVSAEAANDALRIAAIVHAAAVALDAEV